MKLVILYGLLLWAVALMCSCSLIKVVPEKIPLKVDTVFVSKTDTIKGQDLTPQIDSLTRVIDSLNISWAQGVDSLFNSPESRGNRTKQIVVLKQAIEKIKADYKPCISYTTTTEKRIRERTVVDSDSDKVIGAISTIVALLVGLFIKKKNEKRKD